MNSYGDLFNFICKNKYGGGRWPDCQFEEDYPEIYNFFLDKMKEEQVENAEEVSFEDEVESSLLLLTCLAHTDDEDIPENMIEVDHDLGYSSYSIQEIAKHAISVIERLKERTK